MPLPIPNFILSAAVNNKAVKHQWSRGKAMVLLGSVNPTVEAKLGEISLRGLLALAATLAEWMHARFGHLDTDQELEYLIEAIWAASIDFRYLKTEALKFEANDSDPIRGPIQQCKRVLWRITEVYFKASYGIVRYEGALGSLVNHVLPDTKSYQAWLKSAIKCLPAASSPSAEVSGKLDPAKKKSAPRGVVESVWGTRLPREALDPAFNLKNVDLPKLIDDLLQNVCQPQNPFLRSPSELAKLGMSGTPYRYGKPKP